MSSPSDAVYVVKERCAHSLGWSAGGFGEDKNQEQPMRSPSVHLATLTKLELCAIRKAENRYKLAQNTRFYRVEVAPVDKDMFVSATRKI
jgi:hypothetical protein